MRPLVLIEQPHMEHVVDAGAGRKLQPNGDLVDKFGDAVWSKEARLQFAAHSLRKRCGPALTESKQRPIADLIGDLAVRPVVVALLVCLCLLQTVVDVFHEFLALLHALGNSRHPGVPKFIGPDGRRIMPVDHTERSIPQGRLVSRVE